MNYTQKIVTFNTLSRYIKKGNMKLILLALASFFAIPSFSQSTIINDPHSEQRTVSSFSTIKISGGFEVYLTQGNEDAVAVSGNDQETTDAISTQVTNGVLTITFQGNWFAKRPFNKRLRAYISCKKINLIEATGACEFKISGKIQSDNLLIKLGGASDIEGLIDADNLSLDLEGASVVKLQGTVQNLKIDARGASDIKDYGLQADNCITDLNGASDVRITVNKSLIAKARGASTLYYHGNPERTDISSSGASSISNRN